MILKKSLKTEQRHNSIIFIVIIVLALIIVTSVLYIFLGPKNRLELVATKKQLVDTAIVSTEIGIGWSVKENPEEAVEEAATMALEGKKDKTPEFAIIFATSGSEMPKILSKARLVFGDKTKIYGGTSDSRAVMANSGFIRATERGYEESMMEGKRGIALMTVSSEDILFGVGSANISAYSSIQEGAKTAVLNAIINAGKSKDELPKIILITPTQGIEEEALEGIEELVGKNIPVLGGTAGGPKMAVFGEDEVYDKGVSIAVIYTDLPIGWTFEGGFDVTEPRTGIATKVEGQDIVEIDNKPALDVYDEWLNGKIKQLYEEIGKPDVIRDLLTLHPLYRKYTSPDGKTYFLFSHPWPKDPEMKDKSVSTSTKIRAGERIYLSHGTWETLVNRIGNLPTNAKLRGDIDINAKPLLGIGYICGGVMGTIPESERPKLPLLINYANNNAPFIATFTWGEQGQFPGIGNKHGNLLTSFIVIGQKG